MAQQNTIEDLERLKAELLSKVQNIDQTIVLLRTLNPSDVHEVKSNDTKAIKTPSFGVSVADKELLEKYADYDKNATMLNKVAYILKKENRFLHLRQISKILHINQPEISEKDFTAKLYPAIAKLKSSGAIVKYSVGASNVNSFWGSKNWLSENGIPKEKHKYDENEVTSFGSEIIEI